MSQDVNLRRTTGEKSSVGDPTKLATLITILPHFFIIAVEFN